MLTKLLTVPVAFEGAAATGLLLLPPGWWYRRRLCTLELDAGGNQHTGEPHCRALTRWPLVVPRCAKTRIAGIHLLIAERGSSIR